MPGAPPASLHAGGRGFALIGIDVAALRAARRRFAYGCMGWSERRPHLAGALGAVLVERCLALGWLVRQKHSRALTLTEAGAAGPRAWLASGQRDLHVFQIRHECF